MSRRSSGTFASPACGRGAATESSEAALKRSVPDPSEQHRRRENGLMLALVSPALLVILLLIVLPVGWLAWQSVYQDGFTLEHYRRVLTEAIYWRSFALTFEISLAVTVIALLLGYPWRISPTPCRRDGAS